MHRLVCLLVLLVACSGLPGGEDAAALQVVQALRIYRAAPASLQPTSDDYRAVFDDSVAAKIEAVYDKLWEQPIIFDIDPEETEVELLSATTEDFKAETAAARKFPNGYKRVAEVLRPGVRIYLWRYTAPSEPRGTRFDGLVRVNGHWAWFPKPWRALDGEWGKRQARTP